MSVRAVLAAEGLTLAALAAGLGYGATYVTKHYVPALWFVWLGSGALIAFALARWRPRLWVVAAVATPSLVLIETFLKMGGASPTAAALGLGFGIFWAVLAVLGATLGRTRALGGHP